MLSSAVAARRSEPGLDPGQELIAHDTVGVEPLLAIALDRGRVGGRPVFDRDG